MSSTKADNDDVNENERKLSSIGERKRILEEFWQRQSNELPENKDVRGSVRKRQPVQRSSTEVPQRVGSFRKKIFSWFLLNDTEETATTSAADGRLDTPAAAARHRSGDVVVSDAALSSRKATFKHQVSLREKLSDMKISTETTADKIPSVGNNLPRPKDSDISVSPEASSKATADKVSSIVTILPRTKQNDGNVSTETFDKSSKPSLLQKPALKPKPAFLKRTRLCDPYGNPLNSITEVDKGNHFGTNSQIDFITEERVVNESSSKYYPLLRTNSNDTLNEHEQIYGNFPMAQNEDNISNSSAAAITKSTITSDCGIYNISSPLEIGSEAKPTTPTAPHSPDNKTSEQVIRNILDELIATEESYVQRLHNGIRNYLNIFERDDLPEELQGREYELFANIQDIAQFHKDLLLPTMQTNRESAETIFRELQEFIEKKCFHIYILYTINKKRSMQLCSKHKQYFQKLQTELGDRLGINSFLLQPIQRMARYPLLLTEIIKALYKHKKCPLLTTCCHLEYKFTNLVKTLNASECINEITGIDITDLFSTFRRFDEFEAYDYTLQRRYQCKLFLFDTTIIATEVMDSKLEFRLRYSHDHLQVTQHKDGFTLDYQGNGWDDCKCAYNAAGTLLITKWLKLIQEIIPHKVDAGASDTRSDSDLDYRPHNYRRCEIFEVTDHTLETQYTSKLFLFAECLVYTEVRGSRTLYRGTYRFDELGILPDDTYFTLFRLRRYQQNCDFTGDPVLVKEWLELLRSLATLNFKRAGSFRRKFSNAVSALSPKNDERAEWFH